MITTSVPRQAHDMLASGAAPQFVDVREFAEYASGHAPGVKLMPLGRLKENGQGNLDPAKSVVLICKSGKRSAQAAEFLDSRGFTDLTVVDGGMEAWAAAGLPVQKLNAAPWSLERQVRLAAGLLVLAGLFIPPWPWLSAFVGAGLAFAAITNTCGMAMVLARMPWNRERVVSCETACSK
jgi:rhodanese-related sulfurtransferase